jgi:phosphatidylserine decarboxylase
MRNGENGMQQLPTERIAEPAGPPDAWLEIEPLDPAIRSIQPGGGVCMRIELVWGRFRRWWLRTFRPGYVRRMAKARQGTQNVCPHEVLDPRDVKFYRNLGGHFWLPQDDPFAWRDRLRLARVGLAEAVLLGGGMFALAALLAWLYWPAALLPALLGLFFVCFFRDPPRAVPAEPGLVVGPADGKLVAIEECEHDPYIGGPAVTLGIFLSVFNVHINRTPIAARVVGLTYRRGKFLNALRAASARENEQMIVRLQETAAPYRRMIVRQIAGAIARRIVCWAAPAETLDRGERFGMIKLGSRTELVLPKTDDLEVRVRLGQRIQAGSTVMAAYTKEG